MKFRALNIVVILLLTAMLSANFMYMPAPLQWWWFVMVIWAYVSIVFYGCVRLSLGFFMPVMCKAATNEKVVALSFDDGPDAKFSMPILDTLKQYNVPATFFCIGKHIASNETILKRYHNEGHIIGNHSYSHHFWFDLFGSSKMQADVEQMTAATAAVTGLKPLLFRPPYGVINPNLKRAIKRGGYTPVGWSIRSFDTAIKDKEKLLSRITERMTPGAIILLHDSVQLTAELLPELIAAIQKKGYRIERLDKMLNIKAYA